MVTFGSRLRKARISLDLTLDELAEKIGNTKSTISRYENDLRVPNGNFIKSVADVLDVSTDYLLCRDEKNSTQTKDPFTAAAHKVGHTGELTDEEKDSVELAIKVALSRHRKVHGDKKND